MGQRVFLSGLAAEAGLIGQVLGPVAAHPARAETLAMVTAANGPWPVAMEGQGGVDGVMLDLDPAALARLDHALRALGLEPLDLPGMAARAYLGRGAGAAFPLSPMVAAVVAATLDEILKLQNEIAPERLAARLHSMLVRAASRVRASSVPTRLRHMARPGDVTVARQRLPYAHFFAIEEYDVSWRRFDGEPSDTVTRAAFLSGDAVTVLPYDPRRDRVLVVEQFRAGPLARGDEQCWQIEAIAGRVDPFETPEGAARREAVEEAGLVLSDLRFVSRYYPSPGAVSEYLYSYVALTDLPDDSAGIFGQEDEAEDIRGHLLSFDRLMELVASGEIENAPLILTALWLQRERPALRGEV